MALLEPRRLFADEGLSGALRFAVNLLRYGDERRRLLAMRHTFRTHKRSMLAVGIVAHKPG
jgi:hypothetical protein